MTQIEPEETRIEWEGALVQRACAGDVRAFERLYREHVGRVYGLCLRMTRDAAMAEDCAQETFINAWKALPRFEVRSSLATWLHRIAVNVALAKRRKATAVVESPVEDDGEAIERDWTLETPLEVNEIEAAIERLPEGARDVLVLHAIYGYSHIEAAQMLGVAEGTCKAQLHRARSLLREVRWRFADMTNANGGHGNHGNGERKVTSLRDLPRAVEPPRDLWAGIEAAIVAQGRGPDAAGADRRQRPTTRHYARTRWLAVAATIAALAVGVWIGRSVVPTTGSVSSPGGSNTTAQVNHPPESSMTAAATAVQAAYLSDPKFREQRAALVKSLETQLASLPPDSRTKVISSLATIHKSMQDLEAALGKDPANALLQELLLNTYQDEMRVLTTVHEASDAGKGI